MRTSTKSTDGLIAIAITLHFLVLFSFTYGSTNEYAVLAAESSNDTENFCIIFFKEFAALPDSKSKAQFELLQDDSDVDWCEDHPERNPNNKVSIVAIGNCSISTQALNVQNRGAKGVYFVLLNDGDANFDLNDTDAKLVNISVGLVSERTSRRLKEMGDSVSVKLFYIADADFDFSLIVIWLLAVFTVYVGANWSGRIRYEMHCQEMSSLPGATTQPTSRKTRARPRNPVEDSTLRISPLLILFFVCNMVLMLVALYFLYDYLVYFIITIFTLASMVAVYSCLCPLVLKIPGNFCKYEFRCGNHSFKADFRHIMLILFSIGISIFWAITRKDKYAWILQDALGISFCIHMLKTIRLGSLKICTLLLSLLFVYDVFFVFITPLFTSKGISIMEEVATGRGNSEMLPMLLKVSHFRMYQMTVCYQQFSILGLGDLLIPGLLVSYCHGFDLIAGTKRIYFFTTVAAYGIGMLVTFMALFLMDTAQPALLYLVPCVLIPPILLGWCRGELAAMWTGFNDINPIDASSFPEVQVATTNPPEGALTEEPPTLPTVTAYSPKDPATTSEGIQEVTEEKKNLLQ